MNKSSLQAEDIANYLDKNRTFFHVFPNLLDELSIPHPKSGKAVSLLERQIYQLRGQRDSLQVEVDALKDIAGENGELFLKVQQFTRRLMATQTEQQAVDCIYEVMDSLFQVEHVAMVTWDAPSECLKGMTQLGVSQTWAAALKARLEPNKPGCSLLENEWQKGLFHSSEAVDSVCVLPLGVDRVWGVLALGACSDRFHPNQGTYFLTMMSELVTAKLNHLFDTASKAN
ncbi:MAG: DUF484 family protein [Gammaproteobacteria bacterium]|nr:DUF484 family protein [Gammaproteobacteria bacterium]